MRSRTTTSTSSSAPTRQDGFSGAVALYRSALAEADDIRHLASQKLSMGSWLTVKVQMADLYAAQLAGRGYTAVKFFDGDRRGCFRCRLNRKEWRTDLRMVPTVSRPDTRHSPRSRSKTAGPTPSGCEVSPRARRPAAPVRASDTSGVS